jgi:hypothetical protein
MLLPKSPLPFDEREKNLPVWAQKQLVDMRRRVQFAEEAVDRARAEEDIHSSDAILHPYGEIPKGLGTGNTVRFKLGNLTWEFIDVRVSSGGVLQVMGGQGILIHPQASNVVSVRMAK